MEWAGEGEGADAHGGRIPRPWLPLLAFFIVLTGCQPYCLRHQHTSVLSPSPYTTFKVTAEGVRDERASLAQAQAHFAAGDRQEAAGLEGCVDLYYYAALDAWRFLDAAPTPVADPAYQTAWQIYRQSLVRLIATGCRTGRLDPRGHLIVVDANGRRTVPIAYYGFPWKAHEFSQVRWAADFPSDNINRRHCNSGLGISLVAIRQAYGEELFYPPRQHFPVTAVLRPAQRAQGSDAVLEFYNPYLFDSLPVGPRTAGLERDLTAPFASLLKDTPRKFTEGFLDPNDADVKPQLFMMEPYQRGKIPVVFIHGLWSDPVTWVDAVNDLRAQRDIYSRYQFWYFRYPTGRGQLESAAVLREQLRLARQVFDPAHTDGSMDRMVLVGHSMGGLVAKLQVTTSEDILWRQAANRPLESVRTTSEMRERLRRLFFFDPAPSVTRVVFIGTPHRGSVKSRQVVGRLASSLVRISAPQESQYEQLMNDNHDIFAEYLWDSWPTTIDLLEPTHPLLQGLSSLPVNRGVRLHSIIGTGGSALSAESGDGVVSVSSARLTGVCSELLVPMRHEKLHRCPATVSELTRILRAHASEACVASTR